ncbi:bifunctional aldolase/short-chain dehydrogenase [Rhizosaccharibacter radicis]|uniref:Bifunctional aldolase/short-chain dehydrogenase n=1 Tax=Rhizosaccharibacter radicis TaxID=2782605 RepID=A0ABT1W0N4_9PROT|nr:bifunctional aldolase/short-chain dehydrogenase [Acetobacteraceae bacterium KSS12]
MDSLWSDQDARDMVARYERQGVNGDLALRTYGARLLGSNPRLVMHGGGNTSVKTVMPDLFGTPTRVLCIKGSGRDLATIEPDGHPAVRLEPLFRLRELPRLSDEDMVNAQRQNLLDTAAPNPSVETLLHAYLPHKFIDHTHSVTSTAIAALPDLEAACREIWGRRMGVVPYIMPGFQLARAAAEAFERDPAVDGLILAKHGIFTFNDDARTSYELMIEFVSQAERFVAANTRPNPLFHPVRLPEASAGLPDVLPVLRGLLAEAAEGRAPARWLLSPRTSERIRRFTDGEGVADYAARGVATPEQVIRIKAKPCLLPAPTGADPEGWREATRAAIAGFVRDYDAYFARNNQRVGGIKRQLDPLPRVFLLPGHGLVGVGRDAAEAFVSADVAEAWIDAVLDAEDVGRFESISEADHFDMEYWSLEQAKLGRGAEKPLARRVVAITGGGGAIGAAAARAFRDAGADIAVIDRDEAAAMAARDAIGGRALALGCDLTDPGAVREAFAAVAGRFGGLDIVVSNAGSAEGGTMEALPDEVLRRSFELNFFAHQTVARAAVSILKRQGMGGVLLFNVSKQAVNPGSGFGAYGTSKAALMALMRQYALEHGADGIRVNAVNPDRIRSSLLSPEMIRERASARGVDEDTYLRGNLLRAEVRAADVAQAMVFSAMMERTTGNVVTIDGGNVAAMMR